MASLKSELNAVALHLDIPSIDDTPNKWELSYLKPGDWAKLQLSGSAMWVQVSSISGNFIIGLSDFPDRETKLKFKKQNIFKIRKQEKTRKSNGKR